MTRKRVVIARCQTTRLRVVLVLSKTEPQNSQPLRAPSPQGEGTDFDDCLFASFFQIIIFFDRRHWIVEELPRRRAKNVFFIRE